MQSLVEMLMATADYIAEQSKIDMEKNGHGGRRYARPSSAERKLRKAKKMALDPALCSRCQKDTKYKTKSGVAYGSLCYGCMTVQRENRLCKQASEAGQRATAGIEARPEC